MAAPRTNLKTGDSLEDQFTSLSVDTSGTVVDLLMSFDHVQLINDGSDSVYVSGRGDLPSISHAEVKPGEDIKFDPPRSPFTKGRRYIGVTAKSSTQAVRIFAWQ